MIIYDDKLEKNDTIWDKVSTDIIKVFDSEPVSIFFFVEN